MFDPVFFHRFPGSFTVFVLLPGFLVGMLKKGSVLGSRDDIDQPVHGREILFGRFCEFIYKFDVNWAMHLRAIAFAPSFF